MKNAIKYATDLLNYASDAELASLASKTDLDAALAALADVSVSELCDTHSAHVAAVSNHVDKLDTAAIIRTIKPYAIKIVNREITDLYDINDRVSARQLLKLV